MRATFVRILPLILVAIGGCGSRVPATVPPSSHDESASNAKTSSATRVIEAREIEDGAAAPRPTTKRRFQPIELGHSGAGPSSGSGTTSDEQQEQSIIASLQPFQILLGQWKWVTQKKIGDFPKTGDDLEWVWDFQSDKQHPALTAHSDEHPYLHQTWLTYLPVENLFQFTTEDPKGARRVLQGTWAEGGEPADESDGKTLQRTYKLHLTQIDPTDGDQWAVTFKQLDNNQYLVEYKKSPGKKKPFGQFDIVRQQRVGTSFALADSDNPGPKCIISGGLGTMSVTYQGKSYPVCCTGCQAAFNDDPERWLAKLAADEANKKKPDGVRPSHSP